MHYYDYRPQVRMQLESAEALGIRDAVILLFTPRARFEHSALRFNNELPHSRRSRPLWTRKGQMISLGLRDTRRWLTAGVGIVGQAVADFLGNPTFNADHWQLQFDERRLFIGGVRYDLLEYETSAMPRSPFKGHGMDEITRVKNVPGRSPTVLLTLADGSVVPVYSPVGDFMYSPCSVAALAWTASTRRLHSYSRRHRPDLPVSDALLVRILKAYYQPCHVVEAVRALHRAGGEQYAWLVHVIDSSPELANFAALLRKEMPEVFQVALYSARSDLAQIVSGRAWA